MGFLNDMLNPVKHIKDTGKSLSNLASGNIKGALDPGGKIFGGNSATSSSPKSDPYAGFDPSMDPSQYGGDMSDPMYGSLTQPFDVEQFYNYADPGYAFELQQGTQSLQNAASAGSGAFSGSAMKDLLKYSQGFARTGYNDAFNRAQTQQGNIFNRLFSLTQLGQNAAAGVGSQGTQLAANAGQSISNAGSAYGAGLVGAGNAASQGLTNYWLMKNFQPQLAAGGAGAV